VAGGEPHQLTSGKALSLNPWAAPGVIVFDRVDPTGIHIWKMRADGSDQRQLTSGAGEQVGAVSRDGRFVSFTPYDAQQTVSVLSLEDGQVFPVATQTGATVGFSPDGRLLLVSRIEPDARGLIRDVWTAFPVHGGDPVASFRLPASATDPGWTPDGRGVTFRDTGDPGWNVYRQDGEKARPTQVTRFTDGRVVDYAWSRDGARLAVVRQLDGGRNVWVTRSDGRTPVQVTHFTGSDVFNVRWLGDGRHMVVSAGSLSRDAVLIRSFR